MNSHIDQNTPLLRRVAASAGGLVWIICCLLVTSGCGDTSTVSPDDDLEAVSPKAGSSAAQIASQKDPRFPTADGSLAIIGSSVLGKRPDAVGGGYGLDYSLPDAYCTVEELKEVKKFPDVKEIWLDDQAGDAHLEAIAGLQDLEILRLGERTTDEGLKHLKSFPRLKELHFQQAIIGHGLVHLTCLSHLEKLSLRTRVDNPEYYRPLTNLKKLKSLLLWTGTELDDRGLQFLAKLQQVEDLEIAIRSSNITDSDFAQFLEQMPQLLRLSISSAHITPKVVTAVSKLNKVRELRLPYIQDDDLELITSMTELREFSVCTGVDSDVANLDISKLTTMSQLELIDFNGIDIMGSIPRSGLAHLKQFPNLKFLGLSYRKTIKNTFVLTDEDLRLHVAPLRNLETLYITEQPDITDAGIMALTKLRNLETLYISNQPNITDAGIMALTKLTKLKKWDFHSSPHVTEAGLTAFKQELNKQKRLAGMPEIP